MKIILFLLTTFLSTPLWAGDSPVIVDVRSKAEFQSGHIEGALHIPHDSIDTDISELLPDKSQPIVLYCGTGRRAGIAKDKLEALGYTHVENAGGYDDVKARMEKSPDTVDAADHENKK